MVCGCAGTTPVCNHFITVWRITIFGYKMVPVSNIRTYVTACKNAASNSMQPITVNVCQLWLQTVNTITITPPSFWISDMPMRCVAIIDNPPENTDLTLEKDFVSQKHTDFFSEDLVGRGAINHSLLF